MRPVAFFKGKISWLTWLSGSFFQWEAIALSFLCSLVSAGVWSHFLIEKTAISNQLVKQRGSWLLQVCPAHVFYPLDTLVLLNSISKKCYVYPTSAKETGGVKKQAVLTLLISRVRKYFLLFTTSSSGRASKFLSFQSEAGARSSMHTPQPCPGSEAKNVHSQCHSETAGNEMPTLCL